MSSLMKTHMPGKFSVPTRSSFVKSTFAIVVLTMASACTSSAIDQSLTPEPIAAQSPAVSQTPTSETALVPQTPANAGQTAAEAQILTENSAPATGLASTDNQQNTQVASLYTTESVTFLPIEGAPQTKISSLYRSLEISASQRGLPIVPATRVGAKYKVKGYFSALNDGSGTLLIYIWDVVDETGKRLHRINGRERTGTVKTDPWQAITDVEIQRVADSTADRIKSWIETKS